MPASIGTRKTGSRPFCPNLGREEAVVTVQLNLALLGLDDDVSARDALTGEPVALEKGALRVNLAVLGWRIVWLESKV